MSWRSQFKLGRPNLESLFEINPSTLDWTMQRLADETRGLDGSLNVVTVSRDRPEIRMEGNYVTDRMVNMLRSLAMIDDTPLVFEPSENILAAAPGFEVWQERITPVSTTAIRIPRNSYTRGSLLRVAGGGSSMLTPVGIWTGYAADSRSGAGTNYWTSVTMYVETCEALTVADLNGQGSGTAWVKISGGASHAIVVSATSPLAGLKSMRSSSAGTGPVGARYRRLLTFPGGDYVVSWKMRLDPARNAGVSFSADNADGFTNPTNSWYFSIVKDGSLAKSSVGIGSTVLNQTFLPSQTATYLCQVSRISGTLSFSIDATALASSAETVTPDRIQIFTGGVLASGEASGWDDLTLAGTGTGSYNALTETITPGTALPSLAPVYVTYASSGLAVRLKTIPAHSEAGWIDFWRTAGLELLGA